MNVDVGYVVEYQQSNGLLLVTSNLQFLISTPAVADNMITVVAKHLICLRLFSRISLQVKGLLGSRLTLLRRRLSCKTKQLFPQSHTGALSMMLSVHV